MLGHLPPRLLGGEFELDVDAAHSAVARVAEARGAGVEETARAIVSMVDEAMLGALRVVTVQRGRVPSEFALVAFGGAGGLHANALAAILGCYPVIVPEESGVLSALGFIASDIKNEFSQTFVRSIAATTPDAVRKPFEALTSRARDWLDAESVDVADQDVRFILDMRYSRQGYEIPIELDGVELAALDLAALERRFGEEHTPPLRLRARGRRRDREPARRRDRPRPRPGARGAPEGGDATPSAAQTGTHQVWTPEGTLDVPTYERAALEPGMAIEGYAIVEQYDATTVVLPGHRAVVDPWMNLLIRPEEVPREDALDVATLDLIENALLNARFEMDEVVRRAAMSPMIRVQHDEFPMICNARGQMVVGQFGSYIPEVIDRFGGDIAEGDVILLNDPYLCKGSISHCNDWLVILPIFYEGRRVAFASLFGHMMDVGGKVPGSQVSDALSIWEEGIRIPPIKIFDRGVLNETALDVILNNTRTPDMNRSDLMAIIGGCRAAERRIVEICERFGAGDVRGGLRRAARAHAPGDGAHHPPVHPGGARHLHRLGRRRRPRQRPVQDGADDLARGRRLPRRLDGHRRSGAGLDQLPHPRGPLQAVPRDLHDHGLRPRDPLQRRDLRRLRGDAAGGIAAQPEVPGAAVEPAERPHALLRLHERRARPEGARALDGGRATGRARSSSSRATTTHGEYFQFVELLFGGLPARYSADGLDGHSWWPLFRTTPAEYAESYYPVRISSYVPARDTGGAGLHRGGTAIEKTYVFLGPGAFTVNDDRATIPPWGINGGRHGGCSTKKLIRASGEVVELPSKIDQVPVSAGDTLVFRTAGAGGWGDPLDRDPELVLRDVLRDLVSAEAALREYGVVDRRRRRRPGRHRGRARAASRAARADRALRLRPRPDRRRRMTTSLRTRLAQPGALVALGAHDGLTAKIAERAGVEALYHGGYALAAHHFGVPDVGLVGRAEVVESVRRMRGGDRPADHRRRRHRLRLRGRRLADGARARGRRRERRADRGPGLAQALRPHGGQGGDPGRGDGDQGARRRRGAAVRRDADHRPLRRAAGDRARGHDRPLQRLRRGGRRPRLRRRAPHASRSTRRSPSDCSAPCVANMSETGRSPAIPTEELEAMGYKLVIFPSTQTWVFAKAYEELCQAVIRDRTTASLADRFTSFDDVNALLGLAEWQSR